MSDDDIGSTEFENPSPSWKASTAVWRDMPTKSETGTISGIVTAAWPVPDTITQFINDWHKNIPTAFIEFGSTPTIFTMPYTIVSRILASLKITSTVLAIPIMRHPTTIPFAPSPNSIAILLGPYPFTNPQIIPMKINSADISSKYQPSLDNP